MLPFGVKLNARPTRVAGGTLEALNVKLKPFNQAFVTVLWRISAAFSGEDPSFLPRRPF